MSQSSFSLVQCEGWWEQGWYGRQPMERLRLSFEAGRIEGAGVDVIGPFTFSGLIADNGAVAMRKHYVDGHDVEYLGTYDGEGVLAGEWKIGSDHGPWMIRIQRAASDATAAIQEFVPA